MHIPKFVVPYRQIQLLMVIALSLQAVRADEPPRKLGLSSSRCEFPLIALGGSRAPTQPFLKLRTEEVDTRDFAVRNKSDEIYELLSTKDLNRDSAADRRPFLLFTAVMSRFAWNSKDPLILDPQLEKVEWSDQEIIDRLQTTINILTARRISVEQDTEFEIPSSSEYIPLFNALSPLLNRPSLRDQLPLMVREIIKEMIATPRFAGILHPLRGAYRAAGADKKTDPVEADLNAVIDWLKNQPNKLTSNH